MECNTITIKKITLEVVTYSYDFKHGKVYNLIASGAGCDYNYTLTVTEGNNLYWEKDCLSYDLVIEDRYKLENGFPPGFEDLERFMKERETETK